MLNSYIKTNLRRIFNQRWISLINIVGLAIGFSLSFIVLLYLLHETSYDKQHENKDQIYRLIKNYHPEGSEPHYTTTIDDIEFYGKIKSEYPEINKATGIYRIMDDIQIESNTNSISKEDILFLDTDIIDIFTLPIIEGKKEELFQNPFDVILTESSSKVYFNSSNPIGKTLILKSSTDTILLTVKGIIKDFPENSTFKTNILCLYNPAYDWKDYILIEEAYILLSQETDYKNLEEKFPVIKVDYGTIMITEYSLQPFNDIYFKSDFLVNYNKAKGNFINVLILGFIGFIILVVSINNFIIFSIFDGQYLLKDLAVRKIAGASFKDLRTQYFINAFLYSFLAFLLALIIVWILVPYINQFFNVGLLLNFSEIGLKIVALFLISIITGILSGSYLAIYISAQNPLQIFQSSLVSIKTKNRIQKGIVLFQLFLFIGLSAFSLLVNSQIEYAFNKNPGFEKNGLLYFNFNDTDTEKYYNTLKQEIVKIPQVESVTSIYKEVPCKNLVKMHLPKYGNSSENVVLDVLFVDVNFFKTLRIPLINKNIKDSTLKVGSYIINKTAAQKLNIDFNIENLLLSNNNGRNFNIYCVCEDFDIQGIQNQTQPMVIILRESPMNSLIIRTNNDNAKLAINGIIQKINPNIIHSSSSISDQLNQAYTKEMHFYKAIITGNIIVITITVIGLFNVILLSLRKKTKELIIRKILGAKERSIYKILFKEFFYILFIANVLAIPVSFWGMSLWLQNFAYRVNINFSVFLFTASLSFFIILLISFFNIKILMRKNLITVVNRTH